jgi:hypothetical protein
MRRALKVAAAIILITVVACTEETAPSNSEAGGDAPSDIGDQLEAENNVGVYEEFDGDDLGDQLNARNDTTTDPETRF